MPRVYRNPSVCFACYSSLHPEGRSSIQRQNPHRKSYQGSEVDIHITPNPCLEIHQNSGRGRHHPIVNSSTVSTSNNSNHLADARNVKQFRASSWNNRPRVRVTPNPVIDSSSEQNLSSYCPSSLVPQVSAYSANDVQWDSRSLGMDEYQLRSYFSSLRESTA